MFNKSPSELESNAVRIDPVDTKSIALKSVNGIIQFLKSGGVVPLKAVVLEGASGGEDDRWSGGDAANTQNYYDLKTDQLISIEDRINDLEYLVAPVTNGQVRNQINKIIEIFKFDPQLASIQDVEEYINLYGFDNLDGGVANSEYGGHDVIDGNERTIRVRRDSAYNWEYRNPLLMQDEKGLEQDTMKFKIGDGKTLYNDLPYRHQADVLNEFGNSQIATISQDYFTKAVNNLTAIMNFLTDTKE